MTDCPANLNGFLDYCHNLKKNKAKFLDTEVNMQKIIKALDGWKTTLGAVLVGIGYVGDTVAPQYAPIWEGAKQLGLVLTGAGIGHKAMKAN